MPEILLSRTLNPKKTNKSIRITHKNKIIKQSFFAWTSYIFSSNLCGWSLCCSHNIYWLFSVVNRYMEEGRKKQSAFDKDDLEMRNEFRKPRDALLTITVDFFVTCIPRLRELRRMMADPTFRQAELFDHKTHNVSQSFFMLKSIWLKLVRETYSYFVDHNNNNFIYTRYMPTAVT